MVYDRLKLLPYLASAKGTGSTEISSVTYSYFNSLLSKITSSDGKTTTYTYNDSNLLETATDVDGYRIAYEYSVTTPKRVTKISEYQVENEVATLNKSINIDYKQNQTTIVDHKGNKQIMQFNDWGNTVSVQDGEGRATFSEFEANNASLDQQANKLLANSKLQNTTVNFLLNSSFEYLVTGTNTITWTPTTKGTRSSEDAYIGYYSLKATGSSTTGSEVIECYQGFDVAVGETYTFSAYVKTKKALAALSFSEVIEDKCISYALDHDSEWTRLEVSYLSKKHTMEKNHSRWLLALCVWAKQSSPASPPVLLYGSPITQVCFQAWVLLLGLYL